jgi:hypothetical protein
MHHLVGGVVDAARLVFDAYLKRFEEDGIVSVEDEAVVPRRASGCIG